MQAFLLSIANSVVGFLMLIIFQLIAQGLGVQLF